MTRCYTLADVAPRIARAQGLPRRRRVILVVTNRVRLEPVTRRRG